MDDDITNVLPSVRRFVKPSTSADDGAVMSHYARYAKQAVMTVFENIGGMQRFTEISDQNPQWFYEKFFSRMIPKEHEVQASGSLEDMLRKLDEQTIDITPKDTGDGE